LLPYGQIHVAQLQIAKPKVSTTIFLGPKLKIERANKHIGELQAVLDAFLKTNFYRLGIDKNLNDGKNVLTFELIGTLPSDVPLIIGDAIHNLHTALDLVIWEIESRIGKPDRSTKFPFYQTRSELVGAIENGNLKTAEISRVIIDDIKPYRGGNDLLYGLHDLDITDKHKLLIPIVSIVELRGASGEDDCGGRFKNLNFFITQSGRINALSSTKNLKITNSGQPSFEIRFDKGEVFEDKPVISTLHQLWQLVSGIIGKFETSVLTEATAAYSIK
jgi:hypothetical protein